MARTLDGRYRLTRFVASGATGEVWQAVDAGTNRPVAVKVLHPDLAADDWLVERLRQARRALTGLWHPGIARLIDVVVVDDVVALVTDYVPGTDLGRLLDSEGPLAPASAARIGAAMADALAAAHGADMVHGDLKPANVIVPDGQSQADRPARLTDFSVATLVHVGRFAGGPNGSMPQLPPGSPRRGSPSPPKHRRPDSPGSPYTAPWVIDGAVPTPASDVHALGVVLFEMVTGAPTPGPGYGDQLDRLDRRLLEVVDRCVLGDQAARPSAEAVAQRLHELAPHLSRLPSRSAPLRPRAPRSRPRPAAPPPPRRRTRLLLGGIALVVLLVAAIVVVRMVSSAGTDGAPPGAGTTAAAGTVQVPTTPAAATAPTQEGGIQFVGYWFTSFTYAVRTGDTTTLVAATSPDCGECQAVIATIDTAFADGGSMRGGEYLVRRVSTTNFWSAERPVYDTIVDRTPRTVVNGAGTVTATLPPLTFANCVVVLEWTGDQWQVREVVTPGCIG
jgi:protein kinase-like protein/uncharacterized protein DUF6318